MTPRLWLDAALIYLDLLLFAITFFAAFNLED